MLSHRFSLLTGGSCQPKARIRHFLTIDFSSRLLERVTFTLAGFCRRLYVAPVPQLRSNYSLQQQSHLRTCQSARPQEPFHKGLQLLQLRYPERLSGCATKPSTNILAAIRRKLLSPANPSSTPAPVLNMNKPSKTRSLTMMGSVPNAYTSKLK